MLSPILKVVGVTANCGNDMIGSRAINTIVKLLSDEADIVVINCQEVNYEKTRKELTRLLLPNYQSALVAPSYMKTVTKLNTLTETTGIATFILYRTDRVQSIMPIAHKVIRGRNINKGGLFNRFDVRTTEDPSHSIHLNTVSAHLDAENEQKRIKDWHNIRQNVGFRAKSWSDLARKVPDICVSGYDANTRNQFDTMGTVKNPWQQKTPNATTAPLLFAPLGKQLYSSNDTYNTSIDKKQIPREKKRRGFATMGSLDFVAIQNNTHRAADNKQREIKFYYDEAAYNLGEEKNNTARDHNVLISPAISLNSVSDFERVKTYLVDQLGQCAPTITREIVELKQSDENQTLLFNLYQHYLSPTGLVMARLRGARNQDSLTKDSNNVEPWFSKNSIYTPDFDAFEYYLETITQQRDKLHDWPKAYDLMSQLISTLQANQKTYKDSTSPNQENFYELCKNAVKTTRDGLQYHGGSIPIVNKFLDVLDRFLQLFGCMWCKPDTAKKLDAFIPTLKDTYQIKPKEVFSEKTAEESTELVKKMDASSGPSF